MLQRSFPGKGVKSHLGISSALKSTVLQDGEMETDLRV